MVLSPEPGTVDAALFGVADLGFCGEGHLATVTFQVKAPGTPRISVGELKARDAKNRDVGLEPIEDGDTPAILPSRTVLNSAMPNPFNLTTKLSFVLAQAGHVQLEIYTIRGQRVRTLINTDIAVGPHEQTWDGTNDAGQKVSSGIYLMRLIAPDLDQSRQLTLLK